MGSKKTTKAKDVKKLNLALQGGGAHGAYTWGVLDRLLEDERIEFDAITGTSAGAMNGICLAYGLLNGGRQRAKDVLEQFWRNVSSVGVFSPIQPTLLDKFRQNWGMDYSPAFMAADHLTRVFSPYQLNLLNINPMRDILEKLIDFDEVKSNKNLKLFVNATNVRTGKIKVFETEEIGVDQVMASACLPNVYKSVEIDGEYYWDGGYSGNPALFPLFKAATCQDILIVQINPLRTKEVPVTANEIADRVNEISFNSSLRDEIRAINFVSKLLNKGKISSDKYFNAKIHMIDAQDVTEKLDSASKMNIDWDFMSYLRKAGREHADSWLNENFRNIGNKSSIDIKEMFL